MLMHSIQEDAIFNGEKGKAVFTSERELLYVMLHMYMCIVTSNDSDIKVIRLHCLSILLFSMIVIDN